MSDAIIADKEEVKEFQQRLYLEYKFSCLSEKNPQGCDLLGDYYEQLADDMVSAFETWKDNCEKRNFPESCMKYGRVLLKGLAGQKRNREKALEAMTNACNNGLAKGCYYQGVIYTIGTKMRPKDPVKAMPYFEKACHMNDDFSCYAAHSMYLRGEGNLKQNCKKAIEFGEISCDKLKLEACVALTQMFELGQCAKADIQRAKKFRDKADEIRNDIRSGPINMTG